MWYNVQYILIDRWWREFQLSRIIWIECVIFRSLCFFINFFNECPTNFYSLMLIVNEKFTISLIVVSSCKHIVFHFLLSYLITITPRFIHCCYLYSPLTIRYQFLVLIKQSKQSLSMQISIVHSQGISGISGHTKEQSERNARTKCQK